MAQISTIKLAKIIKEHIRFEGTDVGSETDFFVNTLAEHIFLKQSEWNKRQFLKDCGVISHV